MSRDAVPGRDLDATAVRFGPDGLVAVVVQDAGDGRVLMVGWQDAEALEATLRTGEVHFRSRSRKALWRKGETSGNVLALVDAWLDCDADAVLLRVRPAGPTCHTGARSCFDEVLATDELDDSAPDHGSPAEPVGFAWLETLWDSIAERARTRPEGSYTRRLLDGGVDVVARKVAEEATEVILAAKDDAAAQATGATNAERDQAPLAGELADLLYHALVLCAERGLQPVQVMRVLQARHGD